MQKRFHKILVLTLLAASLLLPVTSSFAGNSSSRPLPPPEETSKAIAKAPSDIKLSFEDGRAIFTVSPKDLLDHFIPFNPKEHEGAKKIIKLVSSSPWFQKRLSLIARETAFDYRALPTLALDPAKHIQLHRHLKALTLLDACKRETWPAVTGSPLSSELKNFETACLSCLPPKRGMLFDFDPFIGHTVRPPYGWLNAAQPWGFYAPSSRVWIYQINALWASLWEKPLNSDLPQLAHRTAKLFELAFPTELHLHRCVTRDMKHLCIGYQHKTHKPGLIESIAFGCSLPSYWEGLDEDLYHLPSPDTLTKGEDL